MLFVSATSAKWKLFILLQLMFSFYSLQGKFKLGKRNVLDKRAHYVSTVVRVEPFAFYKTLRKILITKASVNKGLW